MTKSEVTPRAIATVEELIHDVGVKLLAVHPFRLSAERDANFDGTVPEEFDLEHEESVRFAVDPSRIAVRLLTTVSIKDVATVVIDYAAEYETLEPVDLSIEAFQGFVNRVAVMAIWPFTRQSAQDLFLQVAHVAVPLPVIGPDQFEFGPEKEATYGSADDED